MKRLLLFTTSILMSSQLSYAQGSLYLGDTGLASIGLAFPNMQLSLFLAGINLNSPGWFVEYRMGNGPSDDEFYDCSVKWAEETIGDSKIDDKTGYTSFSGGFTYGINPITTVYLGGGITTATNYNQYYDSFEILGDDGKYWIEDDAESATKINLTAGFMFHNAIIFNTPVTFAFALNLFPMNFQLSIGLRFPWKGDNSSKT